MCGPDVGGRGMSENGCGAKEKKRKRDIEGKESKRQAVFKKGRGLWEGRGVNHHNSLILRV